MKISDHKPVSSLFNIDVKVINQVSDRKVYNIYIMEMEEIRRLDRMENEWLPTMTLSQHTLEFETVKFQQAVIRSVEIENTGQTPCHFEFIGKLGETQFCKPWLSISKPKGYVLPGDKQDIEFEIYVNKTTSPSLNSREDRIEDILILHLCKINPWDNRTDDSAVLNVPKELWRILDHLYHNARYQPDLFQQPGLHEEMKLIQENLDTQLPTVGNPLPGSNHSVAEALLIFLEALPEPVIPFNVYPACMEVYNDFERCRALLRNIPVHHLNVFNYLISFLQKLPKHEANGLDLHLI
uniref:Rho-GAP domain-containing protein n=1 Tax=Ciona savignyi TaxID=51511 RepID=H2YK76_CIOSA